MGNKCSGHGTCQEDNTCDCDPGFSGADCSMASCLEGCSGNGVCYDGKCHCEPKWYGHKCHKRVCPKDCTNHGRCLYWEGEHRCECDAGWASWDCSWNTQCKKVNGLVCAGHGECYFGYGGNMTAYCKCRSGWYGDGCEANACEWNKCSGHGSCVNDTCYCDAGWSGYDCSWQICPFDCSENGYCNGKGQCICYEGWTGNDCSFRESKPMPAQCAVHCVRECLTQCNLVYEVQGSGPSQDCFLECTHNCIPQCNSHSLGG